LAPSFASLGETTIFFTAWPPSCSNLGETTKPQHKVLGLLHLETTTKACFRKLVRDEEGKQYRASGLFERLWVSSIREENSRAKRRLAVLARPLY